MKPSEDMTNARYRAESRSLLPVSKAVPGTFIQNVLSTLKDDEVGNLVRKERLILKLGLSKYQKTEGEEHVPNVICSKMREVARLLVAGKKYGLHCMEDFLKATNFTKVIDCVREMTCWDQVTCSYRTPTVVLSLGHSLNKIAAIMETEGLLEGNQEKIYDGSVFQKLYTNSWADNLSSIALKSYYKKKSFNVKLLPLVKDVELLYKYVQHKATTATDYESLVRYTQAYILVFNRKRGGEVQRLKHEDIANIYKQQEVDPDIQKTLTDIEKDLVEHTARIEITGKRGRVALLLTESMVTCLEKITTMNKDLNTRYVFARMSSASHRPYRSSDLLRVIRKEVDGMQCPDRITWTSLRHHLATMAQVFALNEGEVELTSQFMGHDIRIHRKYYRLPLNVLQRGWMCQYLFQNVGM